MLVLSMIDHSYIHIPFCRQKCPYCKFALTPIFDNAKKRRCLAHLENEIWEYFAASPESDKSINTIYFGGGTPSVLTLEEVRSILDCFIERNEDTEISFESNPEDITTEYVGWLFGLWINRISLGIQSLNDETLRAIHRSDKKTIFSALESIWSCMTNHTSWISVNVDFILGLPYSKPWEALSNIRELYARFPFITHTSVYMLEDGLYPKEWKDYSIDVWALEAEYGETCTYFDSLGWHHYEISNWAKPGYECRHNQWYWDHSDSRGFGLSATSYIEWSRWENSHSFAGYYRWEYKEREILTEEQKDMEKIIFDIRTFSLAADLFSREKLIQLQEEKYITIKEWKIVLTPTWILQENTIISRLIE